MWQIQRVLRVSWNSPFLEEPSYYYCSIKILEFVCYIIGHFSKLISIANSVCLKLMQVVTWNGVLLIFKKLCRIRCQRTPRMVLIPKYQSINCMYTLQQNSWVLYIHSRVKNADSVTTLWLTCFDNGIEFWSPFLKDLAPRSPELGVTSYFCN